MMIINRITVSNFGSIRFYDTVLNPELNVIDTTFVLEISVAIEFLLCSKVLQSVPAIWIGKETQLTAEICLNDTIYLVNALPHENHTPELNLTVTDIAGNDVTELYRHALSHCLEQDVVETFDGRDKSLPMRLCWYRNHEEYDILGNLASRTNRLTGTKTFRSHLIQYIRAFEPEPINNKKNYKTTINQYGKFEVFYPGISGDILLSETEEKLFLFICFLNIAEFWGNSEKIRDLHHEKKPLLIKNFLEFLDQSTDIKGLISRTLRLQRQVIILTLPLDEDTKKKWIGDSNERR